MYWFGVELKVCTMDPTRFITYPNTMELNSIVKMAVRRRLVVLGGMSPYPMVSIVCIDQ